LQLVTLDPANAKAGEAHHETKSPMMGALQTRSATEHSMGRKDYAASLGTLA